MTDEGWVYTPWMDIAVIEYLERLANEWEGEEPFLGSPAAVARLRQHAKVIRAKANIRQ